MKQGNSQKQLGKKIRQLRQDSGIRVVDFAKRLGVSRQHIYSVEAGTKGLSLTRLQRVSDILKANTDELLGRKRRKSA